MALLTVKGSAGVAPEVNLNNQLIKGDEAYKQEIHLGFETQGRHHQKFKMGVSLAHKKETTDLKQEYVRLRLATLIS